MYSNIKWIAFDADDTLWHNEDIFLQAEQDFTQILANYTEREQATEVLAKTHISNLKIYGYGLKGYILSMVETAIRISKNNITPEDMFKIIELGKSLFEKPVVLLDNVEDTLKELTKANLKLIVATKGDLLDQERKLERSNLLKYFHHIEVMSNKTVTDYQKLLKHLDIKPTEFLMVGNSLKSDIYPVIELGAKAIHIPYDLTWEHEVMAKKEHKNLTEIEDIAKLISLF